MLLWATVHVKFCDQRAYVKQCHSRTRPQPPAGSLGFPNCQDDHPKAKFPGCMTSLKFSKDTLWKAQQSLHWNQYVKRGKVSFSSTLGSQTFASRVLKPTIQEACASGPPIPSTESLMGDLFASRTLRETLGKKQKGSSKIQAIHHAKACQGHTWAKRP